MVRQGSAKARFLVQFQIVSPLKKLMVRSNRQIKYVREVRFDSLRI